MAINMVQIGIDCNDMMSQADFWCAALGYRRGDASEDNYLGMTPPENSGLPVLYLQKVPEQKQTKNRLHFDLFVEDPEQEIERLIALGARIIGTPFPKDVEQWNWQVMADPEGNEFCICRS